MPTELPPSNAAPARHVLTILAVRDFPAAVRFYRAAFGWPARVDVPVYVEFGLPDGRGLGVYRREAFAHNTGALPAPVGEGAVSGTELYFHCDDPQGACARLEAAGARCLSSLAARNWGDEAAYYADPDGNVLVVARRLAQAADAPQGISVRALTDEDRPWVADRTAKLFGASFVVSRGKAHEPASLPGLVAIENGIRVGLATWRREGDAAELVTIDAFDQRRGIGTLLLRAVESAVRAAGARRLWLVTTNDNLDALRFHQRRGYALEAVHPGALAASRRVKPQIPETGSFGIPLRDELVLSRDLG